MGKMDNGKDDNELVELPLRILNTAVGNGSLSDVTCALRRLENEKDNVCSTGFRALDTALIGGLRNGRLYVIGAVSSLGKTTFIQNIADNIAGSGRDVLFYSLEMSKSEVIMKSLIHQLYIARGYSANVPSYADFATGSVLKNDTSELSSVASSYSTTIG